MSVVRGPNERKSRYLSVFSRHRRVGITVAALGLWPVFLVGCENQLPVALGDQALPGEPVTIEITVPWSDFASNLEVFGGYGSPKDLGSGVLANQYEGTLDARTLMRFSRYPSLVVAVDSTGASRPDSVVTYASGRLVTYFDTVASTNTGPVTVSLGATQVEWDATTTSWDFAIDTINDERAWFIPHRMQTSLYIFHQH